MRLSRIFVVLTTVVGMALALGSLSASAVANDRGQCNGPKHRVAHKTTDLESILRAEGPKALATMKAIARKKGWSERDGSFRNWLKIHTIIVKTKKALTITDYYCPRGSGRMKVWKKKRIPAGTPVIAVLPDNVARDDVSTTPKPGFVTKPLALDMLAQALCANASLKKFAQNLFVRENKTTPPTTAAKPPPAVDCIALGLINVAGSCVKQTQTAKQDCEQRGAPWSWDNNQQACIVIQNNCGNVTVINGNNNTVDQGGNCDTVVVPPPPPPPPNDVCPNIPGVQTSIPPGKTVDQNGNCVPIPPPPPPANAPPTVNILNPPQHVCSGTTTDGTPVTPGQWTMTVTASDPEDNVLPTIDAANGTVSPLTFVSPGQWTVRYTAPVTPGTDTITASVSDGHDHNGDGRVTAADTVVKNFTVLNPVVDLNNPSPTTC